MTDITERLRSLYTQNGTDYVQEAADEIERLRNLNTALSHKANAYVIDNARAAEENERLRAAFEVESALREHWGKQWEEQYAENERLRAEVSELQTEMDGEIQAAKMHIDAYLEANERLRAERDALETPVTDECPCCGSETREFVRMKCQNDACKAEYTTPEQTRRNKYAKLFRFMDSVATKMDEDAA